MNRSRHLSEGPVVPIGFYGSPRPMGWWRVAQTVGAGLDDRERLERLDLPLYLIDGGGDRLEIHDPGSGEPADGPQNGLPMVGYVPPVLPQDLGDAGFCRDHGLHYAYLSGAMANGIGSVEIVEAMGRAGMLGFFGAAGLDPRVIESAVDRIQQNLAGRAYGVNLIHAPQEPLWEKAVADLLIRKGVPLVEASAYLGLTLPVVRYRVHGIHEDAEGRIVTPHRIIAKVSRVEVAAKFLAPPPESFLNQLVAEGFISQEQARLARRIPMAQDITAEADSGGHTDNRPAITLLPTMTALRDAVEAEYAYQVPLRVGLAGGIATPASATAAFAMGAAFVLVGSVHQSCLEAGTSPMVRAMLAEAKQADIAMAPAADMFEMGVNLQVLKRGTMFAMRAAKLYDYYRKYPGLEAIPPLERGQLEKTIFRTSLEEIWEQTRRFFADRDPAQISRAEQDPKHRMALVFRWYLGKSSSWANSGDKDRKIDYQVWCGPSMGAFNQWVKGSFLEDPQNRRVVAVARNILYGAALQRRINFLTSQGVYLENKQISPKTPTQLRSYFIE